MQIEQLSLRMGHKSGIYDLCMNGTDSFLSAAGDGWIVQWNLGEEDGKLISKVEGQLFSIAFDPDRKRIWAGDMNGGVYVIDQTAGQLLYKTKRHQKGTYALQRVGDRMLSFGGDGAFSVWDTERMAPTHTFEISPTHLRAVAVHPRRPILAMAGGEGSIYLVDTNQWNWIQTIEKAHDSSVFDLCFEPSTGNLISAGRDAMIRSWDWETAVMQHEVPAHMFTVNAVAIAPNHKWLLSGSRDKSFKVWNTKDLKLVKVVDNTKEAFHMNSVNAVLWPQNELMITASDDRTIRLWKWSDSR